MRIGFVAQGAKQAGDDDYEGDRTAQKKQAAKKIAAPSMTGHGVLKSLACSETKFPSQPYGTALIRQHFQCADVYRRARGNHYQCILQTIAHHPR